MPGLNGECLHRWPTFAAQLHQESGWRPDAVSPVGAQGLAQFMPATADWISQLMPGLNSREPFNPAWAIRALVSYDRWLWAARQRRQQL
jgi:soluble lytic murein transglycosylase-like protein